MKKQRNSPDDKGKQGKRCQQKRKLSKGNLKDSSAAECKGKMCGIKSPSDTTVYTPALRKEIVRSSLVEQLMQDKRKNTMIDQISQILDGIQGQVDRVGDTREDQDCVQRRHSGAPITPRPRGEAGGEVLEDSEVDLAKQNADQMILNAEQFKLQLLPLKVRILN